MKLTGSIVWGTTLQTAGQHSCVSVLMSCVSVLMNCVSVLMVAGEEPHFQRHACRLLMSIPLRVLAADW